MMRTNSPDPCPVRSRVLDTPPPLQRIWLWPVRGRACNRDATALAPGIIISGRPLGAITVK
jgi:hypothetical protein